jgi:hypothetical protein
MRRGEGVQLGQLRPEAGVAGRGGAGDERSAIGPSAQNAFSATVFGRTARRDAGRAGKGLAGLDEHQVRR